MAEGAGDPAAEWARMQALARDWATIWQSELAAAAQDRELQEGWQALLALWATSLSQATSWPGSAQDEPGAGAAAAARAAAAAAASVAGGDTRDAELARLAARVAELERRLGDPG